MDRKTEGLHTALDVLMRVFPDMPQPRLEKCATLYELGRLGWTHDKQKTSQACIVELGTYHGNGAIALCLGTADGKGLPVYTIDDFEAKKGWAGEHYGPADRLVFESNCKEAGVSPLSIVSTITNASTIWAVPVTLLYWDAGLDTLEHDFMRWERLIRVNGTAAFHDTDDGLFSAKELCARLIADEGYKEYKQWPGGIHTVKKVQQVPYFFTSQTRQST